MGSSLSIRAFARLGSKISAHAKASFPRVDFGNSKYYALQGGNAIKFYVDDKQSMSMTSTSVPAPPGATGPPQPPTVTGGGIMHGIWRSDEIIASSDARLKRNILPLHSHLDEAALKRGVPEATGAVLSNDAKTNWVLRQLRPVSFKYKSMGNTEEETTEAKSTRYGFIAQDLEKILPEVVRDTDPQHNNAGEPDDRKAVVYQDLIAVLTASSQTQQWTLEAQMQELRRQEEEMQKVEEDILSSRAKTELLKSSKNDMAIRLLSLESGVKNVVSQLLKAGSAMSVIR